MSDYDAQQKGLLENFGVDTSNVREGTVLLAINVDGSTQLLCRFFENGSLADDEAVKALAVFMLGVQHKLHDMNWRAEMINYCIKARPELFSQQTRQ